jgi:hypothetical protein
VGDKLMVLSSKSDLGDIKENLTISLQGKDLAIAFTLVILAKHCV